MAGIYSVSQISGYIESMFQEDYLLSRDIRVRGEVSACKRHQRTGHLYFTLKDGPCILSGVMFSRMVKALTFDMKEGQQVIVTGRLIAYPAGSKYEMKAWMVQPDGESASHERYLELKRRLSEKGMFDPRYKMPLPSFPRKIGVVTSSSGAAVQDIIRTAKSRDPGVTILVYSALVQGYQAAMALTIGIQAMQYTDVDVIIIGRGGGSAEDLDAFNDEYLAEAIFASSIPVISAVGHAVDESLSDLVADACAITPTEAAQKATVDMRVLSRDLTQRKRLLETQMEIMLEAARRDIAQRKVALKAGEPGRRVSQDRQALSYKASQLQNAIEKRLQGYRQKLETARETLLALSPYHRLEQGYAFVTDENGKRVISTRGMQEKQHLTVRLIDGEAQVEVIEVKEVGRDEQKWGESDGRGENEWAGTDASGSNDAAG